MFLITSMDARAFFSVMTTAIPDMTRRGVRREFLLMKSDIVSHRISNWIFILSTIDREYMMMY